MEHGAALHCAASPKRQEEVQALLSEVLPKLQELYQLYGERLGQLIECYNRLSKFWGDHPKPFYSKFYNVVVKTNGNRIQWYDLNKRRNEMFIKNDPVWTQCCQFHDDGFIPLVTAFEEAYIEVERSLWPIMRNLKSLLDCCFESLCTGEKLVFAARNYPSLLPKQRYSYTCSLCCKVSRAIFYFDDKWDVFEPAYFFTNIQKFQNDIGYNNWICYFISNNECIPYMCKYWNEQFHPFASNLLECFIKAVVMGDTTAFDELYNELLNNDPTFNSYNVSKPNLFPN